MARRGPDGMGEWFSPDGRVGLGQRRLSIIDLSETGAQPMSNEDGSLWVVLNGEIYNYAELRQELIAKGHVFRSRSDTEVILHLYEEEGIEAVHRMRGMFAFVLWDGRENKMLAVRDPFGIKPLYYAVDQGVVRVASQVKALIAGGGISREIDLGSLVGFFLWGSVPEPRTIFQGIRAVPAGSYIVVAEGGPSAPVQYWHPRKSYLGRQNEQKTREDIIEETRQALLDAVKYHMVADVPVGLFLSSGVDSNVLASMIAETRDTPFDTITLAFEEFEGTNLSETAFAKETAERLGARHHQRVFSEKDFCQSVDDFFAAMDQPSIDGLNSFFVSKAAAEIGLKVAISGCGGDELFGGYPSFVTVPAMNRYLGFLPKSEILASAYERIGGKIFFGRRKEKFRGLFRFGPTLDGAYFLQRALSMPWELDLFLKKDALNEGLRDYDPLPDVKFHVDRSLSTLENVAILDQAMYLRNQLLRDMDWASMWHSLEIRVPLVERFLYEKIAYFAMRSYDRRRYKWLLAQSARPELSGEFIRRKKTGFLIPVEKWMTRLVGENLVEKKNVSRKNWALFCMRVFMENAGVKDASRVLLT